MNNATAIKNKKKDMMLGEDIRKLIPRMAVPTIVAQLITTIYNLVDTFFVSTLGTNATAAVGVNNSLERTITLVGSLIGAGACSYIARLLGAKKDDEADRVLSTSIITGLLAGIIFAIVGGIAMEPMVRLLGATEDCLQYSIQYATYVLLAAPFMIGSFILNMCLRSEGSATYAMIGIGFGGVLNCLLDPLFIYGMGLGVAGASMATAISKTISFIILIVPYLRKRTSVTISVKKFKFVWRDVKEVLSIGSTSFFRSALSVVAAVTINRVAASFSTATLAALSVANRVMDFPFAMILGFGQGYQPVVGFNWGAKKPNRVRESLTFSIKVSLIGGLGVGALIFLTANPTVHVFNSQADIEVLRIGVLCIRLQCITLCAHALGSIVNMFYSGIGRAKEALILSTARQGYCFLPIALIVPWLIGVNGVAATQALADLVSLLIIVPMTIKAFRLIERLEEADETETAEMGEMEAVKADETENTKAGETETAKADEENAQ